MKENCNMCSGSGECHLGTHSWKCSTCDGTGKTTKEKNNQLAKYEASIRNNKRIRK